MVRPTVPHAQRDRRLHRRGDPAARAELAARYLPLARKLALRYRTSLESLDDLMAVASLGLVKALERWDPDRGVVFAAYAIPMVLGELRRHFRDNTWAVRPPRAKQELALAVVRTRGRLWDELGRPPSVAEIAARLGRSRDDVLDALQAAAAQRAHALDEPVGDGPEDGETHLDRLGDADPGYAAVEDRILVDDLMTILDERAREVVRMRFQEDLLQREIAERLGCSQMHVSRILRDSLEKLRRVREQPST
jgi:RNA polymerase sigma-B factor